MKNFHISRRKFLGSAAAAGAITTLGTMATVGSAGLVTSCSGDTKKKKYTNIEELKLPPLLEKAPDGKPLKAGLVGCGGRGTGAAINFLKSGNGLSITAIADVFQDKINECREKLKKENNELTDDQCFLGFDAYEKVIASGVDIVILATPPHFRPKQFAEAVNAGKHVFLEKPVAVDPAGARAIMAAAKKAESLGLTAVTGTQRRHQHDYVGTYKQIMDGAIGDIVSANCYWNQNMLWFRKKDAGWSDMEAMLRDWVNWTWLSGDHIVEQHVHNIDVINWFTGKHPVKAVGFGGRHRRVTGDQYDMFSIDYVYDNGLHMHSMCRQIDGTVNNVSEYIVGTSGMSNCKNTIYNPDGTEMWKFDYGKDEQGKPLENTKISPYDQEHIDMVTAIRTNKPINEAEATAVSTLVGIMGRISAYTGKEVTWDEMMNSELKLGPETYVMGKMDMTPKIPVPGEAKEEKK
jgi:predicted dehydrogenase